MSAHNVGVTLLDKCKLYDGIMADPTLTDADRRVAWALLLGFHNTITGQCFPSIDTLAERARLKRRATFDAIRRLTDRGWFRYRRGGGRGHANEYEPALERVHDGALFMDAQTVHGGARNSARRRQETVRDGAPQHVNPTHERTPSSAAANFAPQGKVGSTTSDPKRPIPAQAAVPGGTDRASLVRTVKTFHISEENAQALVDGALEVLTLDELQAVVARAKASNTNRDGLQAAIGEAVNKWRAAQAAEARAKAQSERETAEQRRQAEAEAARQAEHDQRLNEDPAYRVQTKWFDFVLASPSSVMDWVNWLPGAVEQAGEAKVDQWHTEAHEHAPDRPLSYLRDRLAQWHESQKAQVPEAALR